MPWNTLRRWLAPAEPAETRGRVVLRVELLEEREVPATVIASSSDAFFTGLSRVDTITAATTPLGTVYSRLGDIATTNSGDVYGIRDYGLGVGQIVKLGPFPVSQGQGFISTSVVAQSPLLAYGSALTTDSSGNLLAVSNGDLLVKINTSTGAVNSIGELRTATGQLGTLSLGYDNDLAFGPDGALYFAGGALFRVDTSTALVTQVGQPYYSVFTGPGLIKGLALSNGSLLGFGNSMVTINVQTGVATPIGGYSSFNGAAADPGSILPLPDVALRSASRSSSGGISYNYDVTGGVGSFRVGVYRSSDARFDLGSDTLIASQDIIATQAGSGSGAFPASHYEITASQPYLLVVADPANSIAESSEANNSVAIAAPPGIVWVNRGDDGFESFGANADLARQLMDRAIADWTTLIHDFRYSSAGQPGYAPFSNTFFLTVRANGSSNPNAAAGSDTISIDQQGKPYEGKLDISASPQTIPDYYPWYFDPTPSTDTDFSQLRTPFNAKAASGDPAYNSNKSDFYSTMLHEMGHLLGISNDPVGVSGSVVPSGAPHLRMVDVAQQIGTDPNAPQAVLYQIPLTGGGAIVGSNYATFTTQYVFHLYGGARNAASEVAGATKHPNDLMVNEGIALDSRVLISDLDALILRSVYGYDIPYLPSDLGRFFAPVVAGAAVAVGSIGSVSLATNSDGLRLLPVGRRSTIPWAGIQKFTLALSTDIGLSPTDITVVGANGVSYGPASIAVSGNNYTITLARPISGPDRVTITIHNRFLTNYIRRLDVLPGDVNDDGLVNSQDQVLVRNMLPGFGVPPSIFGDMDGDGDVDMDDYNFVRARNGTRLPTI